MMIDLGTRQIKIRCKCHFGVSLAVAKAANELGLYRYGRSFCKYIACSYDEYHQRRFILMLIAFQNL
jgi:hypothetical protein